MATDPLPESPIEGALDQVLGFEVLDSDGGLAHGRFDVEDRVRQPYGLVHGGAYAAMAESLTSLATALAVASDGMIAVGQSNHTSFLRPVTDGTVHAEAHRRHRGRTSWVWQVDFTDDAGRLCAFSLVTLAVRARPAGT